MSRAAPREKIIEANHFVPVREESFAQMRAQKSRSRPSQAFSYFVFFFIELRRALPCSATNGFLPSSDKGRKY